MEKLFGKIDATDVEILVLMKFARFERVLARHFRRNRVQIEMRL